MTRRIARTLEWLPLPLMAAFFLAFALMWWVSVDTLRDDAREMAAAGVPAAAVVTDLRCGRWHAADIAMVTDAGTVHTALSGTALGWSNFSLTCKYEGAAVGDDLAVLYRASDPAHVMSQASVERMTGDFAVALHRWVGGALALGAALSGAGWWWKRRDAALQAVAARERALAARDQRRARGKGGGTRRKR